MNILGQLGAAEVKDEHIDPNSPLGPTKFKPSYVKGTNFGLAIGGTPTTREEIIHIARAAGTIRSFVATLNDTGTAMDITYDLKVNGASVLSAPVSFTHADADRTVKAGTISSAAIAAGDVISIVQTVTTSTGAQGPYAEVGISENAAP